MNSKLSSDFRNLKTTIHKLYSEQCHEIWLYIKKGTELWILLTSDNQKSLQWLTLDGNRQFIHEILAVVYPFLEDEMNEEICRDLVHGMVTGYFMTVAIPQYLKLFTTLKSLNVIQKKSIYDICGIVDILYLRNKNHSQIILRSLIVKVLLILGECVNNGVSLGEDINLFYFKLYEFYKRPTISTKQTSHGDFRFISIMPTIKDLQTNKNQVLIKHNIIEGQYQSVDHYLDIHFRLLREDFIRPLRKSLKEAQESTTTTSSSSLHVYNNVQVAHLFTSSRHGVVYELCLAEEVGKKKINWFTCKRLMHGGLVCLSNDHFHENFLFGIIVLRDPTQLANGFLSVDFPKNNNKDNSQLPVLGINYQMIETPAFYEAYCHCLHRLQTFREIHFPMKKILLGQEIINAKNLPFYMRNNPNFTLSVQVKRTAGNATQQRRVQVNSTTIKWPSAEELEMDESQHKAFCNALTHNVAVIQGPPGTGKTHIGLKIAKCLWIAATENNLGPILIVCYTNHALDQFLEGIYKFCHDIIRFGSRSQSEVLKNCTFLDVLQRHRTASKFRLQQNQLKKEMNQTEKSIEDLLKSLMTAHRSILNFSDLNPFMTAMQQKQFQLNRLKMFQWLMGNDYESSNYILPSQYSTIADSHLDYNWNNSSLVRMEDAVTFDLNLRQLDGDLEEIQLARSKMASRHDPLDGLLDEMFTQKDNSSDYRLQMKQRRCKQYLRNKLKTCEPMNELVAKTQVDNILILTTEKRWQLYMFWRNKFIRSIDEKIVNLNSHYRSLITQFNHLRSKDDIGVLQKMAFIGMTTTGAARMGRVLASLQPKIVIVEEAAEVLEAHIISSLTGGTEHLILIGDHQQLRPSTTEHELAKEYHLDVSLFERLIRCKIPFDTLKLQHRMRPEISLLLQPIYPDLRDHPSVVLHPKVPGIQKNVYFLHHSHLENHNSTSQSYSNDFEANFIRRLCLHLLRNGIESDKITILSLYSAQLTAIQRGMDRTIYGNIHITTVDNYQGEENDIIILSLVRCNENNKAGFVAVANRICVALSRARNGLFALGNFNLLSSSSTLWKTIVQLALKQNSCGVGLPVRCEVHNTNNVKGIQSVDDFDLFAEQGGCQLKCKVKMNCGHWCPSTCHPTDREHQLEYRCKTLINRRLSCGHVIKAECSTSREMIVCKETCGKIRPDCGHQCTNTCGSCQSNGSCPVLCWTLTGKEELYCGHQHDKVCHLQGTFFPCNVEISVALCSHQTTAQSPPTRLYCFGAPLPYSCNQPCAWHCPHQKCLKKCFEKCDRVKCDYPCKKRVICLECQMVVICPGICGEVCPKIESCRLHLENKQLIEFQTCGHQVIVREMDNEVIKCESQSKALKCPKCKIPLTLASCHRYRNTILRHHQRIGKHFESKFANLPEAFSSQPHSRNSRQLCISIFNCLPVHLSRMIQNLQWQTKAMSLSSNAHCHWITWHCSILSEAMKTLPLELLANYNEKSSITFIDEYHAHVTDCLHDLLQLLSTGVQTRILDVKMLREKFEMLCFLLCGMIFLKEIAVLKERQTVRDWMMKLKFAATKSYFDYLKMEMKKDFMEVTSKSLSPDHLKPRINFDVKIWTVDQLNAYDQGLLLNAQDCFKDNDLLDNFYNKMKSLKI